MQKNYRYYKKINTKKKRRYPRKRVRKLKTLVIILPILIVSVLSAGIWLSIQDHYSSLKSLLFKEEPAQETIVELPISHEEQKKLLTVVNLQQSLPSDYDLNLTSFQNISCDELIVEDLSNLMQAAKQDGITLILSQGYVDKETQNQSYQQKVAELMSTKGYTKVKSEAEAEKLVAPGGKSEQQTGLSVNFRLEDNIESYDKSMAYLWLNKNCVDYGFVVRYPQTKEDETGKTFDPTCYRYVGIENAKTMRALDMCLEEYAEYIAQQKSV